MGITTRIAWTNRTWNPWQGCRKTSPGCKNCYMFRDKARYGQDPNKVVRSSPHTFNSPKLKSWAEPARIFVCSWSDFFIEEADAWRQDAWEIMRCASQHTYLLLTKRPERIKSCLPEDWGEGWPNVWLGVTAEDQARADERIPLLLKIPAKVRFVSVEPMLGLVDLAPALGAHGYVNNSSLKLDWVIVGGESGHGARPMYENWVRSIRDQCVGAGTAFFYKQRIDGGKKVEMPELDGKVWAEFPEKK